MFPPFFASSVVLLLLTTTTTTLVRPAGGTRYTGTDLFVRCATEYVVCGTNDECMECSLIRESASSAFDACTDNVTTDGAESSTAACFGLMAGVCCLENPSDIECLQNNFLVEHWLCFLDSLVCPEDKLTFPDNDCGLGIGSEVPNSSYTVTSTTPAFGHFSIVALTIALSVPHWFSL